jgi:hypothetical protein
MFPGNKTRIMNVSSGQRLVEFISGSMKIFTEKTIHFLILLMLSLSMFSCEKGSPEDVPSYIKIDSIKLVVSDGEGTSSHKISDAWVFVDEELIGAFELRDSLSIPILKAGKHTLKIYPGIKMNGIAATRVPYSFYSPFIVKDINLVRGSVLNIGTPTVRYSGTTTFAWMEDFEHESFSIDSTSRSSIKIQRTSDPTLIFDPANLTGDYNSYSGMVIVPSDTAIFECVSRDEFVLPNDGSAIFLEMNYKTNNAVTVGLFVKTSSQIIQEPLMVLNRNSEWKKIYINLTSAVGTHQDALNFRIFFGVVKETDVTEARFLLDNIKLVHF